MKKMKKNEPTKEQLRELNKHISDALKQWANICIMSDAENWSYEYEFTEEDIMNAVHIFNSIIANVGIKKGLVTEKNVFKFADGIHEIVSQCFNIDTHKFYKELKEDETDVKTEVSQK